MKKRRQSIELDVSVEYFDEEYEVLLLDESNIKAEKAMIDPKKSEVIKMVRYTVQSDVLATLKENENTDSALGTLGSTFFYILLNFFYTVHNY